MKRIQSILAGAAVLTVASFEAAGALADRGYGTSNFAFELEGAKAGFISSVEGGAISAEVVEEATGMSVARKKHLGPVKFEEIQFEAGFGMGKPIYDWISDSVDGKATRKDGAIVAADFNLRERQRRSFQEALITEVTIPACDGASKEPGYLKIKVKPESIENKPGSGGSISGPSNKKQKQWSPANFRLDIPKVNCKGVKKIEAFTIKQKVAENAVGEMRDYEAEPTKVEYPNLRLVVSSQLAGDFVKWHEDFVIKGNNADESEKTGSLSLLSADLKEEIAKVSFFNLGISRLEYKASSGEGLDCVIDLYVERMEIDFMAQFEK